MKKLYYKELEETLYLETLDNGLSVQYLPKSSFSNVQAMISVNYGSMDREFYFHEERKIVPDGIAHFLEHKMFEKEHETIDSLFSKYGAAANAYTTYDHTSYFFETTENFFENLETLIKMVNEPYFTDETVAKEKSIINEEIKMYQDNPDAVIFKEMMKNLFLEHPLGSEILGSSESISKITADDLYLCHKAFYSPENSFLTIVGNFDLMKTSKFIKTIYEQYETHEVLRINHEVSEKPIGESSLKANLTVDKGIIGARFTTDGNILYNEILANIYLQSLFGKSSDNYEKLVKNNFFISYGYKQIANQGFSFITTDSDDLDKFFLLIEEIISETVISDQELIRMRNKIFGEKIRSFNTMEGMLFNLVDFQLTKMELEETISLLKTVGAQEIRDLGENLFSKNLMTRIKMEKKDD